MKNNREHTHFWLILVVVNLVAICYPVFLLTEAVGTVARLAAGAAFLGMGFLLLIGDAIGVAYVYWG